MAESLPRLQAFAEAVRRDGFTDVVLLGMGGPSLAVEVLRATLGVAPGWLRLRTLDSTDPAAALAVSTPRDRTFYIFTSKSGTTIEPNAFAAPFRHGLHGWADHFIAITDEGTELAARARVERFREIFINPVDIGARYSALSFLGLVPAALMGQEMAALVGWGARGHARSVGARLWRPDGEPGRFASVVRRDVRELGVFVECRAAVSIPFYRLVQFQLEREAHDSEPLPSSLRQGRILSAVYRVRSATTAGRVWRFA